MNRMADESVLTATPLTKILVIQHSNKKQAEIDKFIS